MKLTYAFLILLTGYLTSCNADTTKPSSSSHKDSELTLLMRQMYDEALATKQAILANEPAGSLSHEAILTAQSTQPEKAESELYKTFSKDYLSKVEQLNAAAHLDKKAAFKNVVNSCVTCHSSLCPGPLVRIDKLKM